MKSFNLLDEAWIPVKKINGENVKVGLTQVLLNAQHYQEVTETNPLNLVALYRLLLAIVHRSLAPLKWKNKERAKYFKEGFPAQLISEYLNKFRDCFWFFHPDNPFMQIKVLTEIKEVNSKIKPWTQLALDRSCGDIPTVFDHSLDKHPAFLSISEAIRYHLGYLQFVPGGLVKILRISDSAGPLANSAAVISLGANLAETLSLNLHPYKNEEDLPSWELSQPTIDQLKSGPTIVTGPNDLYTRLTRGIYWLPENETNTVNKLLFCEGLAILEHELALDPMVSYKKSSNGFTSRITFQDNRAMWRDLPSIISSLKGKYSIPASVKEYSTNLLDIIGSENSYFPLLVAGLASNKAKIIRWRLEKFIIPKNLIIQEDAYGNLCEKICQAEDIYKRLTGILNELIANSMLDSDHNETKEKARAIQKNGPALSAYFSKVESSLAALMQNIIEKNINQAFSEWNQVLENAIDFSWQATCKILGSSQRAIIARAQSSNKVNGLKNEIKRVNYE